MTPSQRAAKALDYEKAVRASFPQGRNRRHSPPPVDQAIPVIAATAKTGRTSARLAIIVGCGETLVRGVLRVRKCAPELIPAIREGKITVQEALRTIEADRAAALCAATKLDVPTPPTGAEQLDGGLVWTKYKAVRRT